ncbi:sulfate permease [Sulfurimonas sp. HSL-1716]|uniref:SulP family inorganic anion transporter n=1 Tax=Hydrocurvibacter sulfurireducens TaxID=3131937 RepID=UPI0031F7B54B
MKNFFEIFSPKSLIVLQEGYKRSYFMPDLVAGITVGVVALPLAMAFAIASGLGPEKGLYTAIVAGILISLLGGSRFQIGGPTGAFVVIIYDIVMRHGYEGLAVATLMAGLLLIVMGLLRFGAIIKYIPYPVITGFTSGIALIIFTSQINDFLGLKIHSLPSDFLLKWETYFKYIDHINPYNLALAFVSIVIILTVKRYFPRIPGPIIAVIFGAVAVSVFHLPVDTIQSRFGDIPRTLPSPSLPVFDFALIKSLIPDALTIALLAAIESLLSAVVADGMTGRTHKSDTELIAQGAANIGSIFFGGIPATGAIARTATNIKSGAKTPLAGIVHGIVIALFMFLFAEWIIKVPMAVMAAILVIIAWNMSEIHHFKHILQGPKSDAMVLVTTFVLTVLVDLTVAVQVGVVLASLLFIKRVIEVTQVQSSRFKLSGFETDKEENLDDPDMLTKKNIPEYTEIYEIDGPFFFGVADSLKRVLETLGYTPKVFILRMRKVPVVDATGMHALEEFYLRCKKQNTRFILSGVNPNLESMLKKFGFYAMIGEENVFDHIDKAINAAEEEILKPI